MPSGHMTETADVYLRVAGDERGHVYSRELLRRICTIDRARLARPD